MLNPVHVIDETDQPTVAQTDVTYIERPGSPLQSFKSTIANLVKWLAQLDGGGNVKLAQTLSLGSGNDSARIGTALGTGWATVSSVRRMNVVATGVTSTSKIFLTPLGNGDLSTGLASLQVYSVTPGSFFTVQSNDIREDRSFNWLLLESYAL